MINTELYTESQLKELAFTREEREQLARARKMPITFDEECPPTTPERAVKFRRVNPPRSAEAAEKEKIVEDYLRRVNPYGAHPHADFDLRGYAAYIEEHGLKGDEITPEIMEMFKK